LDRVKETDTRSRIHGHTYLCRLHLTAPLNDVLGWTIDYGDVKEKFNPIFDKLDHKPLYEIAELSDNDPFSIARWIKASSASHLTELERIDLFETRGCGVTIDWGPLGPALPI
jgi:6-pyruvoyltetrahydropterin/6-carboxytetrahydropterin synthase